MRRSWLILPLLGIAGYFAVFGGEYSWLDVRRLERERAKQEEAVRATKRDVKGLRARADSLERDSATIEKVAREQYGLIRPGERLYRFAGGATGPAGGAAAGAGADRAGGADSSRSATTAAADSAAIQPDSGAGLPGHVPRDTTRRRSAPPAPRATHRPLRLTH